MNYLKAIKFTKIASTKPSLIRSTISEIEDEHHLTNGAIHFFDDRVVIFATEPDAILYSPALLKHFGETDALVVVVKSERIYIFVNFDGEFRSEFEFDVKNEDDSSDLNRLRSFCSVYQNKLESIAWYCNAETKVTGKKSVAIAELIKLPLDPALQEDFSSVRAIKPMIATELANEISKGSKKKTSFAAASFLIACSIAGYLYQTGETRSAEDQSVNVHRPVINQYYGLELFWTKHSASPKPILRDIYRIANQAALLRGWDINEVKVVLDEQGFVKQYFVLESVFGQLSELAIFAQENNFDMNVNGAKAYLARKIQKQTVFADYARFHTGTWHNWLSASIEDFWDDVDYAINTQETSSKNWIISEGEITFPIIHTADLESIGSLMYGFPYSFRYLEMKLINRHEKIWEATMKIEIAGVESNA